MAGCPFNRAPTFSARAGSPVATCSLPIATVDRSTMMSGARGASGGGGGAGGAAAGAVALDSAVALSPWEEDWSQAAVPIAAQRMKQTGRGILGILGGILARSAPAQQRALAFAPAGRYPWVRLPMTDVISMSDAPSLAGSII